MESQNGDVKAAVDLRATLQSMNGQLRSANKSLQTRTQQRNAAVMARDLAQQQLTTAVTASNTLQQQHDNTVAALGASRQEVVDWTARVAQLTLEAKQSKAEAEWYRDALADVSGTLTKMHEEFGGAFAAVRDEQTLRSKRKYVL